MAKFCMFCGNQLPDVAAFCPICGKKQPVINNQNELDLTENNVAVEQVPSSPPNSETPAPAGRRTRQRDTINPPQDVPAPETSEVKPTASRRRGKRASPFNSNTKPEENIHSMPTSNSEVKYDLPDDFSINTEPEIPEVNKETLENENKIRRRMRKEHNVESISSSKPKTPVVPNRRRRKVEDTPIKNEPKIPNDDSKNNSSNTFMENSLFADEQADAMNNEELDEAYLSELDEEPSRARTSEGRKQVKTKDKSRKHSSRNSDINKKVYKIEHDLSNINQDDNYDGYYENVLPIDIDDLKKNKLNMKNVLLILGFILLLAISGLFIYLLL